MYLSKEHINFTLGISIPLSESAYLSKSVKLHIIQEQLLYETFLDSIKKYASEKYNQAITNITDWKDIAVVMGKVLSDSNLLNDFLKPLERRVERLILSLTDFLKKQNLGSWVEKIKSFFTKIKSLTGWKKFMLLTTLGSIIIFITKLSPEKIVGYFIKLFSSSSEILTAITSKLTDFTSYIGWLQPIINGVEIVYKFLKPLIEAFSIALKSGGKFATKLIKENMKTQQQLRKLIREIILSEIETTSPTNTNPLQGNINIELFKKLNIADFDAGKFSTTINLVKNNKSLNMAANKILADTMVALIKTDDDALLNQIFSNIKQVKS